MPPHEPITREELFAFMDVLKKNNEQMASVANYLQRIAEGQDKTNGRLYNGMAKEIVKELTDALNKNLDVESTERQELRTRMEAEVLTIKNKLDTIKDKVNWVIIIFGSIAAVVAVSSVIMTAIHAVSHGAIPKVS